MLKIRFTEEEYEELLKKQGKLPDKKKKERPNPKPGKYGNNRTRVDGIIFDSKKEADYYGDLKLLLMANEIKGFCRQPEFILLEGSLYDRPITYKADFIIFHNDGTAEVIDVKGFESQQWKRTYKMFRLKYPELELKVVK